MSGGSAPHEVRLHRAPEVLARELDGRAVLYVGASRQILSLDPVATRLWDLLVEPLSVGDLCSRLAAEFDVPLTRVADDVRTPLAALLTAAAVRAEVLQAG
jgi:hypothetical protein